MSAETTMTECNYSQHKDNVLKHISPSRSPKFRSFRKDFSSRWQPLPSTATSATSKFDAWHALISNCENVKSHRKPRFDAWHALAGKTQQHGESGGSEQRVSMSMGVQTDAYTDVSTTDASTAERRGAGGGGGT